MTQRNSILKHTNRSNLCSIIRAIAFTTRWKPAALLQVQSRDNQSGTPFNKQVKLKTLVAAIPNKHINQLAVVHYQSVTS